MTVAPYVASTPDPFRSPLTPAQRRTARVLVQRLRDRGVVVNGQQVAEHFDAAMAWHRGTLRTPSLLKATGWEHTWPAVFPEEAICRVELTLDALDHIRHLLTQNATPESEAALLLLPVPPPPTRTPAAR
ncbi:hypothetical protein [Kitasatospora sp. NPDC088783]|uniref:hypothetical protein n=1 Tax=Kitasatospora sp. NPDC088783 TaxID=3364077 RepID=UPI00382CE080